jgi:tetratricopeptide (TPR) repeat protein
LIVVRSRIVRLGFAFVLTFLAPAAVSARVYADAAADCFSEDIERRIEGCTALIEQRDQSMGDLSLAYAMRALAYSLKGQYDTAIQDYDTAINMRPDFAVALNNRAWAYFRWGKAATGLPDVEKSLELSPTSAHALDTRAHIKQSLGDQQAALRDYDRAMWYGGARMIKLYQCGLTEQRLYTGEIDGTWRPELQTALEQCVRDRACDPLPADEHCRAATS